MMSSPQERMVWNLRRPASCKGKEREARSLGEVLKEK